MSISLVMELLDRPVAFHRIFAKLAGSVTAGLFLSQAHYWSKRIADDHDGWFYKVCSEWEEETCLTRREQEGARAKLRAIGVLEEKFAGQPGKLHFRINYEVLWSLLESSFDKTAKLASRPQEEVLSFHNSAKLASTKPQSLVSQIVEAPIVGAENTSENTTESNGTPSLRDLAIIEFHLETQSLNNNSPSQSKERNNTQRKKGCATVDECMAYAAERGFPESDGEAFFDAMEANGWRVGENPCKSWQAAFRTRERNFWLPSQRSDVTTRQNGQRHPGGGIAVDSGADGIPSGQPFRGSGPGGRLTTSEWAEFRKQQQTKIQ